MANRRITVLWVNIRTSQLCSFKQLNKNGNFLWKICQLHMNSRYLHTGSPEFTTLVTQQWVLNSTSVSFTDVLTVPWLRRFLPQDNRHTQILFTNSLSILLNKTCNYWFQAFMMLHCWSLFHFCIFAPGECGQGCLHLQGWNKQTGWMSYIQVLVQHIHCAHCTLWP